MVKGSIDGRFPQARSCFDVPVHVSYRAPCGAWALCSARVPCSGMPDDHDCRTPAMTSSSIALWRDGRGRLSLLRIATLALLLWPIALAITAWQTEIRFEARPVNDLIHRAGFWMLMFLLLSLAVTPLRRIARYGQLVDVRRMIGVGAFCYGVAHISLYIPGSGVRPRPCGERDRVAGLSHGRLHRLARPRRAGGDVDRWNDARARRPALAAPAPAGLSHRRIGAFAFLPADQARRERADPGDGAVPLAGGLSSHRLALESGRESCRPGCCWR